MGDDYDKQFSDIDDSEDEEEYERKAQLEEDRRESDFVKYAHYQTQ